MRAQVTLRTSDNVPENYITNSWAFQGTDVLTNTAGITTALKDFYDDWVSYMSPSITQNGHTVKYYELPGNVPNYPFEEDVWNLAAAPSGTALPSELAVCLSFQGDRQAGFPQARRRGRVYLGPFDTGSTTGDRPATALLTALGTAAAVFAGAIDALTGSNLWAVWSPSDQVTVPITDGWIDNAWDIQRRRGVVYTSRTTFVT
jgi:hypothetical protein